MSYPIINNITEDSIDKLVEICIDNGFLLTYWITNYELLAKVALKLIELDKIYLGHVHLFLKDYDVDQMREIHKPKSDLLKCYELDMIRHRSTILGVSLPRDREIDIVSLDYSNNVKVGNKIIVM
jgi:hypothetical protein